MGFAPLLSRRAIKDEIKLLALYSKCSKCLVQKSDYEIVSLKSIARVERSNVMNYQT